jgi:hypothetical protein
MALPLSSANAAALAARTVVPRDFLWLEAKHRDTGAIVREGYWSDVGTIEAEVIGPDSGIAETRSWFGAGQLIGISPIPAVSNLTVQTVSITLSQIDDRIAQMIRTYDPKFGRVEIFRGLLSVDTRLMVAPAFCRYVGIIDQVEIETPEEGGEGAVLITASSHTVELTRTSAATRSDADQRLRSATDDFFADAAVVGTWKIFWGQAENHDD